MIKYFGNITAHWRAIGILVLLLALTWFAVLSPIAATFENQLQERDQSLRLLSAYKMAVASKAGLETELTRLRAQGQSTSGLVGGNSSALAAARLQSDIRMLVERNGG